jgi:hypothetical protein
LTLRSTRALVVGLGPSHPPRRPQQFPDKTEHQPAGENEATGTFTSNSTSMRAAPSPITGLRSALGSAISAR